MPGRLPEYRRGTPCSATQGVKSRVGGVMMSSKSELAKQYAEQIRQAAKTTLAKAEAQGNKVASAPVEIRVAVESVFAEIGDLEYDDGTTVPGEVQEEILEAIDVQLGVPRSTFSLLRKGSVQQTINYQQMLTQLVNQIRYVPPPGKPKP
jgi:hypothetical protein